MIVLLGQKPKTDSFYSCKIFEKDKNLRIIALLTQGWIKYITLYSKKRYFYKSTLQLPEYCFSLVNWDRDENCVKDLHQIGFWSCMRVGRMEKKLRALNRCAHFDPECISLFPHLSSKVLFKKVKSSRKTDRQREPGGGINLNFRLSWWTRIHIRN